MRYDPLFCADLQMTIAQRIGNDPDAALKEALHQAVQQIVGTLVNSESLVKNDEMKQSDVKDIRSAELVPGRGK